MEQHVKVQHGGRRTGKTTRLIDDAIQFLFEKKEIRLWLGKTTHLTDQQSDFLDEDHKEGNMAQEDFVTRFMRRIRMEHNLEKLDIDVNYGHVTIKLIKLKE